MRVEKGGVVSEWHVREPITKRITQHRSEKSKVRNQLDHPGARSARSNHLTSKILTKVAAEKEKGERIKSPLNNKLISKSGN